MARPHSPNPSLSAPAETQGEGSTGGGEPRTILADAYTSWERCTWRERRAIQEGNWIEVAECQRTKQELQETILRATEAARRAVGGLAPTAGAESAGCQSQELEHEFGPIVHDLIRLETRNAEMVGDRRQAAASEKAELENAVRNLSRVKNSYVQPPPVVWHSYS